MLKHCSGSNLDVRCSNTSISAKKKYNSKDGFLGQLINKPVKAIDSLEKRLSVSLMFIDKEDGYLEEIDSVQKPLSISNRYQQRLHKHNLSQSLDGEVQRVTTESIRVYASCLRSDISYLTVLIICTTTASQVITGLLRMRKIR